MSHAITYTSGHAGEYTSSHALQRSSGATGDPFWFWSADRYNRKLVINIDSTIKVYDLDGGGLLSTLHSSKGRVYAYDSDNTFTVIEPNSATHTVSGVDIETYNYSGTLLGTMPDSDPLFDNEGRAIYGTHIQYGAGFIYDQVQHKVITTEQLHPIPLGSTYGAWTLDTNVHESGPTGGTGNDRDMGSALSGQWTIRNNRLARDAGSLKWQSYYWDDGVVPGSAFLFLQGGPTDIISGKIHRTWQGNSNGIRGVLRKYDGTILNSKPYGNTAMNIKQFPDLYWVSGNFGYTPNSTYGRAYSVFSDIYFSYHPATAISGTSSYNPKFTKPQESYWDNVLILDGNNIFVGKIYNNGFSMELYNILTSAPVPLYNSSYWFEENYFYYDHLESGFRKVSRIEISTGNKQDIVVV